MKISKLRFTSDECVNNINIICSKSNISISREDKNKHIILNLNGTDGREGMIRIYDSKKGRTLDGSQKDISFNEEILIEFESLYCGNNNANIIDKWSVYIIENSKIEKIREVIEETAAKNIYIVDEDTSINDTIYYRVRVIGKELKDKITVTQFNSGKLLIQGTGWQTWDDICESIEKELQSSVKEILVRYMSNDKDECIDTIITNKLLKKAEEKVISRLELSYEYLYKHDRKLIVSSQAQLLSMVNYGDFYCYVAPVLKVIEGYLIKTIVDLRIKTETEILELRPSGKPKFNFSCIFEGNSSMRPEEKKLLVNTSSSINQKEQALLEIYDKYSWRRSPYQHDGVPPIEEVNSYEDAENIFDEIIAMINNTHKILFN
jgi:hypothetical protein